MNGRKQPAAKTSVSGSSELLTERGFAGRVGFGLRPAILVIDLIVGFTDLASPLAADLFPQVSATLEILRYARRGEVPVIFSTVEYDPSLKDAGLFPKKAAGLNWLIAGSRWVELDPRLQRHEGELLLKKKYASCFFGTDLLSLLNNARVDTLVVTGCTTSGCVRATVVDALQYGFRAIVPREAVGDRLPSAHEASLVDIDMKYGDVVPLAEAISYLQAIHPVPVAKKK